jgi:hypothetical protein
LILVPQSEGINNAMTKGREHPPFPKSTFMSSKIL